MKITHATAIAISDKIAKLVAELNFAVREGASLGITCDSDIMTMNAVNGSYPVIRIAVLVRPSNLILE